MMAKCDRCGKRFRMRYGTIALGEFFADEYKEGRREENRSYYLCIHCTYKFMLFMEGVKV